MLRRFCALIVLAASLCAGAGAAHAKVPIPCTGEKIVKVADLPRTAEFTLANGQHVDLGYLYQSCFSGKWVGYVGSSSRFVTWKDGTLPDIAATAGMPALPAEPGFFWGLYNAPGQFVAEWLWIIVVLVAIAFGKAFGPAKVGAVADETSTSTGGEQTSAGAPLALPMSPEIAMAVARTAIDPATCRPARVPVTDRANGAAPSATFGRRS